MSNSRFSPEKMHLDVVNMGDQLFRIAFKQEQIHENDMYLNKSLGCIALSIQASHEAFGQKTHETLVIEPGTYIDETLSELLPISPALNIDRAEFLQPSYVYIKTVGGKKECELSSDDKADRRHLLSVSRFASSLHMAMAQTIRHPAMTQLQTVQAQFYPRHLYQTTVTGLEDTAWLEAHYSEMEQGYDATLDHLSLLSRHGDAREAAQIEQLRRALSGFAAAQEKTAIALGRSK